MHNVAIERVSERTNKALRRMATDTRRTRGSTARRLHTYRQLRVVLSCFYFGTHLRDFRSWFRDPRSEIATVVGSALSMDAWPKATEDAKNWFCKLGKLSHVASLVPSSVVLSAWPPLF